MESLTAVATSTLDNIKQRILKLSPPERRDSALVTAAAVLAWLVYRTIRRVRVKTLIRGLPGPPNPSWLAGNFPEIYDVLNVRWHQKAIATYGRLFQINGMFGDEQLYVTDPRAMHQILVKEHAIFEEPQSLLVMNRALLGEGLLATLGPHHKKQRKILNPVFSVKQMRNILPIISPFAQKLREVLESQIPSSSEGDNDIATEINVHGWAGKASLEFIAQGGMGMSMIDFGNGTDGSYLKLVKEMVPTVSRLHIPMQLLPPIYPLFSQLPAKLRLLAVKYSPVPAVRKLHEITDSLWSKSWAILMFRRTVVMHELKNEENEQQDENLKPLKRSRDILSVLLRAQVYAPQSEQLPDSEVISQITTLLFAAQDTTSSALARILHVLAGQPDVQSRLRTEVRHAKQVADQTESAFGDYDALMSLTLLDAVVRETLRLYPPVSWIWRVARAPTTLPLYQPISLTNAGGKEKEILTSIPVAKGQGVVIGIAASQRDSAIWGDDADSWRPERWLSTSTDAQQQHTENNASAEDEDEWKVHSHPVSAQVDPEARYPGIYSGMMTFSGGARSCIGFKFALLALKLLLATLIDRFEFGLPAGEIVWNMNHIAAPTVRGREAEGAQMPLKVSIAV